MTFLFRLIAIVAHEIWALVLAGMLGCTAVTTILTNPPDALVTVDGERIPGSTFRYGRWVGNEYLIRVSASGFDTAELSVDVELGDRAGAASFFLAATLVGIPFIPAVIPFNGELDERIYFSLKPQHR